MGAVVPVKPTVVEVLQDGIKYVGNSADSVEFLTCITEFALSIIDAIGYAFETLCEVAVKLCDVMATVLSYCTIVKILKRIRDWCTPDENGQMLWEKAWHSVTSMVALTVAHISKFVQFLAVTLKAFSVGIMLTPLRIIADAFYTIFAAFDIVGCAETIKNASASAKKALEEKEHFEVEMKTLTFKEFVNNQQKHVELISKEIADIQAKPASEENTADVALRNDELLLAKAFVDCKDEQRYKTLCERKIEQFDIIIQNAATDKKKAWVTIAFDISMIVLSIFSIIAAFIIPGAILLTLIICGVANAGLDVGTHITNYFIKSKKVPTHHDIVCPHAAAAA